MERIAETPLSPHNKKAVGNRITSWRDAVPLMPKKDATMHHIARSIYTEMCRQRCTYQMMSDRSGVSTSAIMQMRRRGIGLFVNVEAMANVLGLQIVTRKTAARLADEADIHADED